MLSKSIVLATRYCEKIEHTSRSLRSLYSYILYVRLGLAPIMPNFTPVLSCVESNLLTQ